MRFRRSLVLLVLAVAAGGGIMLALFGVRAGLWTAVFLLLVWGVVLGATHGLMAQRARLGSVRMQLGIGVALPLTLGLCGVQVIALALFVSAHDAVTLALLLGSAAVLAAYCAWLWTTRLTRDVREVRDAVAAIGSGERSSPLTYNTQDELAELGGTVNQLADRLWRAERERDEMDRSRRELLAAVSHDLRTPLSSVRLLVEELRDGVAGARSIERLAFHVESLESLIDDLFELSRIEAGDIQWPIETIVLDELIDEAVEGMQTIADDKDVTLVFDARDGRRPVRGNPEKIQRVLFNLFENAIHHAPASERVFVSTSSAEREVLVEVRDSGGGIDRDLRERVFEPFYRGGTETSRPRDGAGLGLPICRAILEAHGGRIWLAEGAHGVTVRFALPAEAGSREENP